MRTTLFTVLLEIKSLRIEVDLRHYTHLVLVMVIVKLFPLVNLSVLNIWLKWVLVVFLSQVQFLYKIWSFWSLHDFLVRGYGIGRPVHIFFHDVEERVGNKLLHLIIIKNLGKTVQVYLKHCAYVFKRFKAGVFLSAFEVNIILYMCYRLFIVFWGAVSQIDLNNKIKIG